MNKEELEAYVRDKGYSNVKVTVFSRSFKVHYEAEDFTATRNCFFPIQDLPIKLDGSKMSDWLRQCFPRETKGGK